MEDILAFPNQIASDYYQQRQAVLADHASRIARALAAIDLTGSDVRPIRDLLAPEVTIGPRADAGGYRATSANGSLPTLSRSWMWPRHSCHRGYSRAPADRLAAQALGGSAETRSSRRSAPPAICSMRPLSSEPGMVAQRRCRGDGLSDWRSLRCGRVA